MKRYLFILLVAVCNSSQIRAQLSDEFLYEFKQYLLLKFEADSLYNSGEFDQAAIAYSKFTKSSMFRRIDYYFLGCAYSKTNSKDSAVLYLNKAIENGLHYFDTSGPDKDANLIEFKNYEEWETLRDKLVENTNMYLENSSMENNSLKAKLKEMGRLDQLLRKPHTNRDSIMKVEHITMREIDSLNRISLKKIVDEYGWPTLSMVGKEGDEAAWAVVQHADLDTAFQQFYFTYVFKAFLKGETQAKNVAYLIDRILVNTNRNQIFGTQFRASGKGDNYKLELKPIDDPKSVNKYRKAIGLETLEKYLEFATERFKKD